MNTYLFIFSISPVQSFISQARKTKDLYAGSRFLSEFTKLQIEKLKELVNDNKIEIIFPYDFKNNNQNINLIDSLPNRFVAKIMDESDNRIKEIGKALEKNFINILKSKFKNLSKEIIIQNKNKDIYVEQLLNTFETYWTAVKFDGDYKKAYTKLEKKHAAIKNIKKFKQLNNGNGEQGRKCSLCGERNGYFYGNYELPAFVKKELAIQISTNEPIFVRNEILCTVCALKRFYESAFPSTAEIALWDTIPEKYRRELLDDTQFFYDENLTEKYFEKNNISKEKLPEIKRKRNEILKKLNLKSSELPKYYALIVFDGDNMGKFLAGEYIKDNSKLESFHKNLSKALSENAKNAKNIVNKYGRTVYAGGDDFLGFVSLGNLMKTLKELIVKFKNSVNEGLKEFVKQEITMSAGIVIAHYKVPLKVVLDWARKMEDEAKNIGKRNAFSIAVIKHSGEIHKTVWKWYNNEILNIDYIEKILEKLILKKFSTNFIHKLEDEFKKLSVENNITNYKKQFKKELKRLINKSFLIKKDRIEKIGEFETFRKEEVKKLLEYCNFMFLQCVSKEKIFNYFSLMKIIDFIARQLGGEK